MTLFAFAIDIIDTASAKFGVLVALPDVFAMMPATNAFNVSAAACLYQHALTIRQGSCSIGVRVV